MPEELDQLSTINLSDNDGSPRYIDFKLDFSFRHFFAKENHLDLLRDFLNGIFEGRKVIKAVRLGKTDRKGDQKNNRKTVFDVYCTGDKGENFVVEMQKGNQMNFKDRILFYTANLIQEQGRSVDPDWDYHLPEVYFVAVMDFMLEGVPGGHYVHDVRLVEMRSQKQFYDKLGYIYIELPGFNKSVEQLESNEDKWLFCLKHMRELNEIPVSLSTDSIFKKLFTVAEVSNLTQEDMNAYQQELKRKRDNYSYDQYILQQGIKQGIEQGIEEGIEKGEAIGRYEEALEIARELKKEGLTIDFIAKLTKLTLEEIQAL